MEDEIELHSGTARRRGARRGQTIILVALMMVVLCGAGALAVDVGITAQKNHFAQDAAANAANAGAHFLYGHQQQGNVSGQTYSSLWNIMVATLAANGLTVHANATTSVDPCNAGYTTNQVVMSIQVLDALNASIASIDNTNTSLLASNLNTNAWGVHVSLRTCQQAAFGGVLGHPRYTISVDATAGRPLVNPTPTANGTPTSTPTSTPTPCPQSSGRVVTLNTGSSPSLSVTGSVHAAEIDVNSSSQSGSGALSINSGGTVNTTAGTFVRGTVVNNAGSGSVIGPMNTSQATVNGDPLATMPTPSVPGASCPGDACYLAMDPSGGVTFGSGLTYYLQPGHYTTALNFNSGSTYCLAPGVYYIEGSWNVNSAAVYPIGYTSSGGAQPCGPLTAGVDPGVVLYFKSGTLQLAANGDFTHLVAPQTGPYANVLYWQDVNNTTTSSPNYKFAGGVWYEPGATLQLNNGAVFTVPLVVASDITVSAGASLTAVAGAPCDPNTTPTITPIPNTYTVSSFYIYGKPQATGPTQMLFAAGAPGGPSTGDLVTFKDVGGHAWPLAQYPNRAQGISGTPAPGITIHDASDEGCLDPNTTTVTIDGAYFNHGGAGHCANPASVGSDIQIPVVDEVSKQGTWDPCASANNGGYCVHVLAIVTVHVTYVDHSGHLAQGYITGVSYDPTGVVALPPAPTAVPTSTPTVAPTNTPMPTAFVGIG